MINSDAYKILGLTGGESAEQIKSAYRKLAMQYHPDRNAGGLVMMQALNEAFDLLQDTANHMAEIKDYSSSYSDDLLAVLNVVCELEGVNVELCGTWVWLTGNTKEHKDTIKAAGCFWSAPKASWYYRPEEYSRKGNRKTYDMDAIRIKHGSEAVKMAARKKIAA